ncbi:uncharacterized protein LOC135844065 [Planococcus citri]|uniref:uncharacterized protein LOC135844065 n=1 Tax=Planococcus citri TaxID=170843 RepID=UPI0031F8224F
MESNHSQESLPDFHFTPRTLQDIAASKYAFISWCNSSDLSHIPPRIRSMINDKIQSISKEIRNWNNSKLFIGDIPREVMINCAAFNSSGGICSRRTVRNLFKSDLLGFDSEKQFEIACSYCIEDDIERLWPSVKDDERFLKCQIGVPHRFHGVDVMDYWCCRMRGELKEVYGPKAKSPEWYVLSGLLSEFHVKNWTEIEYFWTKLNTQEKSSLIDKIWIKQDPTKHTSRMIVNSNDTVLNNLVRSKCFLLIGHFVIDDVYCQYALQLWNYGKSSIVEGATFYNILFCLSNVAFKSEYKYVNTILKEIWLSAPGHLRNYVTWDEDDRVASLFNQCLQEAGSRSVGGDFDFLIELLKGASFRIRQQVWFNWWLKFTLLAKVSDLQELMTLCFDNVNDIVKFKKTNMLDYQIMRHNFENFVHSELSEELSEYLMFCCSDADDEKRARVVRMRIIFQNIDWIIGHKSDFHLSKIFQFFDGCFTMEEAAVLLECPLPDKETGLLTLWISFSCFESFGRILRCLKFSDQRLMELKRFFKQRCRHVFTLGNFNSLPVDDWDNFLKWCEFSPEEFSELRCNIQIDNLWKNFLIKVFVYKLSVVWKNCRDSFVALCFEKIAFKSMDGFLRWYFGSEQAAREFKWRKMNDHENMGTVRRLNCF